MSYSTARSPSQQAQEPAAAAAATATNVLPHHHNTLALAVIFTTTTTTACLRPTAPTSLLGELGFHSPLWSAITLPPPFHHSHTTYTTNYQPPKRRPVTAPTKPTYTSITSTEPHAIAIAVTPPSPMPTS